MITEESKLRMHSPTKLLLEEWGSSGKRRATVSDLLTLLTKTQLYQAADFVAENLLAEAKPSRPASGPSARYPIIDPSELEMNSYLEQAAYPNTLNLERKDNRSHLHNRKNSRTNHDVDLVKPMEGIGLSTRDDNLSESEGLDMRAESQSNNMATPSDGSSDVIQITKQFSSSNASSDISNGYPHIVDSPEIESELMPKLSCLMSEVSGSSCDITFSAMHSENSQNGIPNLDELIPSTSSINYGNSSE